MTVAGKSVLIVEDEERLNRMVKYLFMAKGCKVESATNGIEALEVLKETTPDAIVLDVMMPEMDGFTLCERLKGDSKYKDIPVIVLSTLKEEENRERLISMGACDYVEKPFKPEDLVERVQKTLGRF